MRPANAEDVIQSTAVPGVPRRELCHIPVVSANRVGLHVCAGVAS